jgi:hypothetical protein
MGQHNGSLFCPARITPATASMYIIIYSKLLKKPSIDAEMSKKKPEAIHYRQAS